MHASHGSRCSLYLRPTLRSYALGALCTASDCGGRVGGSQAVQYLVALVGEGGGRGLMATRSRKDKRFTDTLGISGVGGIGDRKVV